MVDKIVNHRKAADSESIMYFSPITYKTDYD